MNPLSMIQKVIIGMLLAVILSLIVTSGWLYVTKAHLEVKVAEDAVLIGSLQTANESWVTYTNDANKKLQKQVDQNKQREADAAKAVADAQKSADDYFQRAKVLQAKVLKGDECVAIKKLFSDYFAGGGQ